MANIDSKNIIERLKGDETPRGRVTVYLDKGLFKDFKGVCSVNDVSASRVLEELMKGFIENEKDSLWSEPLKK